MFIMEWSMTRYTEEKDYDFIIGQVRILQALCPCRKMYTTGAVTVSHAAHGINEGLVLISS